jgi:uncharacterized membrane protein (DUF106 family)
MADLTAMLSNVLIGAGDLVLGWLLRWPQEVALAAVAILTAALLAFVRLATTDQDRLRRCRDDKRRLKQLVREAKKRKDKQAVRRHQATIGMIGMVSMRSELRPLLVSLLPIVILATWAFARLAYVPPRAGEPVEVRAFFPVLSIGQVAHIAPRKGLSSDRWLARVTEGQDASGAVEGGQAVWHVAADAGDRPHVLEIRQGRTTVEKQLYADGRHYARPVQQYAGGDIVAAQVAMEEFHPFGLGGISAIHLSPWTLGYLVIAIPFAMILRKAFRIL